jgi:hypothetical protein
MCATMEKLRMNRGSVIGEPGSVHVAFAVPDGRPGVFGRTLELWAAARGVSALGGASRRGSGSE